MNTSVRTTCPYCGVGCGILARVGADGRVDIQGDPEHPANRGRLCSKGSALAETLDLDGRLLHPEIRGERADWDRALDLVADRFQSVIRAHGPEAVAFYVSGQLLTEDYYVANKLMKGFIGAANIDTNSRLCMSSAVAGHKRALGTDTVPCEYDDLERAELIVIAGSNTAWCHPVLYQRIVQARSNRPDLRVVLIDPRRTATADAADLHLAVTPGTDVTLFNGLLGHLDRNGHADIRFLERSTEGAEAALATARTDAPDVETVAARCGLSAQDVSAFYGLFAATERVLTLFSQGINQSSSGTDKVNAILNCHLYTGRIGRPGMGPFSLTGQPNAMGGREVGGLANQLAAHMELDDPMHRERVGAFWNAPRMAQRPGLKAVELFDAVRRGQIRALWVMATNPAVSLPDSDRIRAALASCEFLVVSDCVRHTDTTEYAHVLLPAQTWGEKDGTVTNSERRISRQRRFLESPGEARPDWWIITECAKRMGHGAAFAYESPAHIFREHAALSGLDNHGRRGFDIGALAGLDAAAYQALAPVQWPLPAAGGARRPFADGRFPTPSGRARLVPVAGEAPASAVDGEYPLVLNTGRVRDHWHTLTRTAKSPRLSAHSPEPLLEIHPEDAARYGIPRDGLVEVVSRVGRAVLRARLDPGQRPGSVFAPMHWSRQYSSLASVGSLIAPHTDPHSGQPEFKYTPVRVRRHTPAWHGFLVTSRRLNLAPGDHWTCARTQNGWRYEIAGDRMPHDWPRRARELFTDIDTDVEWSEYSDRCAGHYRSAWILDGRLRGCLFVGPDRPLPSRDWLVRLLDAGRLDDAQRRALLSGRPGSGDVDQGPTVCACAAVGRGRLLAAIRERGLDTVEALGAALGAGTHCGSCLPELRSLLADPLSVA